MLGRAVPIASVWYGPGARNARRAFRVEQPRPVRLAFSASRCADRLRGCTSCWPATVDHAVGGAASLGCSDQRAPRHRRRRRRPVDAAVRATAREQRRPGKPATRRRDRARQLGSPPRALRRRYRLRDALSSRTFVQRRASRNPARRARLLARPRPPVLGLASVRARLGKAALAQRWRLGFTGAAPDPSAQIVATAQRRGGGSMRRLRHRRRRGAGAPGPAWSSTLSRPSRAYSRVTAQAYLLRPRRLDVVRAPPALRTGLAGLVGRVLTRLRGGGGARWVSGAGAL